MFTKILTSKIQIIYLQTLKNTNFNVYSNSDLKTTSLPDSQNKMYVAHGKGPVYINPRRNFPKIIIVPLGTP